MQKFTLVPLIAAAGLAAACGAVKDDGHLADAPSSDTGVDAAPAPVKVTVLTLTGDGVPDATAKVLFQDAAGNVVADVAVDPMGHAEAMLPDGGNVSAIRTQLDNPTDFNGSVTTMVGVKPGDDLTFGIKPLPVITNQGGATTMTANFTPNPSATAVTFYTSCGSVAGDPVKGVVVLNFRDSCHGSTFDLIGVATGANLPTPQFIKLTSVAYSGGGTFNIPTGFVTMSGFTVNLTNVPEGLSSVRATRSSMIGDAAAAPQIATMAAPAAGTLALVVPYAQGFGTRSELAVALARSDAQSFQTYDAHTQTLTSNVTLDLASLPLPWITDLKATPTGATWTTVLAAGSADGMLMHWTGTWTDATQRNVAMTWRVIQPAAASGVTLPKLPSAYAKYDPQQQAEAVTPGIAFVVYGDYDQVDGYDALRKAAETLLPLMITPSNDQPAALGAFVGMPYQRRLSITTTFRRG